MLEVGYVAGAHGIRGGLRIVAFDAGSTALSEAPRLGLTLPDADENPRWYVLRDAQTVPGKPGLWRVSLRGIEGRAAADDLKGQRVVVERAELAPLAPDEFYLADTVGVAVVREIEGDLQELGVVVGTLHNGAQDLLEVEWTSPAGKAARWLIPALPGFVLDVTPQRILVDVPRGMLPDELEGAGG